MNLFKVTVLAATAFAATSQAATLYNLDFTPPEVGSYTTIFGNPTVVHSVGPFTDALFFHAVTTYDQIELPLGAAAPQYDIQYDVLTHNVLNSKYGLTVTLDTPNINSFTLHGGLNKVDIYQSFPYTLAEPVSFLDDHVYHFDVSVDFAAGSWSLNMDGAQIFAGPFSGADLQDIRITMAPVYGGVSDAPDTYAAIDNVIITAVPEPSAGALVGLGLLLWLSSFRRGLKCRTRGC
jgi:hypothetical protein